MLLLSRVKKNIKESFILKLDKYRSNYNLLIIYYSPLKKLFLVSVKKD
ncbi:hypothetical protein RC62_3011 [Flavobacterium aquidurense]|uniref:Uncharacterized protein n=1 Tax=Flavobacterium aquidurense TaxID=362413 RepID=A0A0Q0WPY5_9FLAO|nr:hypothetical protein RC62_3011 [Flavobacterium aquidurense]